MQRLELTWIGKDQEPRLEPRILLEKPELRCGQPDPSTSDWQGMLIHGDNLLALKALEQDYAGKVKCVYIDPPYNTGNAFEHYDDGVEHSLWLNLMYQRLKLLKSLLSDDGTIFVQIDDKEMAYLKVLMDEVFERRNFLNMLVVKTSDPSGHKTVNPSPYSQTEYVLMYSRERQKYKYEQQYIKAQYDKSYNKIVINRNDHFSEWIIDNLADYYAKKLGCMSANEARKKYGRLDFEKLIGDFALENPEKVFQLTAISDKAGRETVEIRNMSNKQPSKVFHQPRVGYDDIYFLDGRQIYFLKPKIKKIDNEVVIAKPLTNLWTDIPYNGISGEGYVSFKNGKKPEKLLRRCVEISTNPGDLVLDSFLGSGTTAAVAHKMGRRWIGIELGEHAYTHSVPRLRKVINGEDQGGVSKTLGWKGGGGMRVFTLAPTLILADRFGQPVINPEYNPQMLAAAVCKHEGYRYDPHPEQWWKQGQGAEQDYILTTTQYVNRPFLDAIQAEMQETESLLICCKAYDQAVAELWPNITLRKIPSLLASRCEFDRDDYSLNIVTMPTDEEEENDTIEEIAPQVFIPPQPKQGELF